MSMCCYRVNPVEVELKSMRGLKSGCGCENVSTFYVIIKSPQSYLHAQLQNGHGMIQTAHYDSSTHLPQRTQI
jgi:hypothetical protein